MLDILEVIENDNNYVVIGINRYRFLFSYKTLVAAWNPDLRVYVKTDQFYNVTTSKHINRFTRNTENKITTYELAVMVSVAMCNSSK